jgi:hypothetical protein
MLRHAGEGRSHAGISRVAIKFLKPSIKEEQKKKEKEFSDTLRRGCTAASLYDLTLAFLERISRVVEILDQ